MICQSVYASHQDWQYLQTIANLGVKKIFTSLHIVEELVEPEQIKSFLTRLCSLNFEIIADVSPNTLQVLSLDQLQTYNITTLRIDYGFTEDEIVALSKRFKLILNASTLTDNILINLANKGLDLSKTSAMHNFYPQNETGLAREQFNQLNHMLRAFDLTICAFIPGDQVLRGPIHSGLPTLEEDRHTSPYLAYLKMRDQCADVYIGDPQISKMEMKMIIKAQADLITIPITSTDSKLLPFVDTVLTVRQDSNHLVFRIEESRTTMASSSPIEVENADLRLQGTITINNHQALRYNGEVMINRVDLPANEERNIVGNIGSKYIDLTQIPLAGKKIIFKLIDEF